MGVVLTDCVHLLRIREAVQYLVARAAMTSYMGLLHICHLILPDLTLPNFQHYVFIKHNTISVEGECLKIKMLVLHYTGIFKE